MSPQSHGPGCALRRFWDQAFKIPELKYFWGAYFVHTIAFIAGTFRVPLDLETAVV
jgi:hypothetical protein